MNARLVILLSFMFVLTGCFSQKSDNLDALYNDGDAEMDKLLNGVDHIEFLYNSQRGGVFVESVGRIVKILDDQITPYPAQVILIRLSSGQKLIIKHDINLGSALPTLKKAEALQFKGIYKWNDRGGMILSTHKNNDFPKHSGWLKYDDKIYQ